MPPARTFWRVVKGQRPLLLRCLLPFILTLAMEVLLLAGVYGIPFRPFSWVFAPIVHAFWGEAYLHYPSHLVFLLKAIEPVTFIVVTCFGTLMTGVGCVMLREAFQGRHPSWASAVHEARSRYGALIVLWLAVLAGSLGTTRAFQWLLSGPLNAPWTPLVPWAQVSSVVTLELALLAGLCVQAALLMAFPALVLGRVRWWQAVGRSLGICGRRWPLVLLLIVLPSWVMAQEIYLRPLIRLGMAQLTPDLAFAGVGLRLALTWLNDVIVTTSATFLFLLQTAPSAFQFSHAPPSSTAPQAAHAASQPA